MEKLSGILPSNARIRSVDTKDSKPARPGAPAFGRPQGTLSIQDRFSVSKEAADRAAQDLSALRNGKEFARARMVEDISNKFFETRLKDPALTTEKTLPSEVGAGDLASSDFTASELTPTEFAPNESDVTSLASGAIDPFEQES